MRVANVRGRPWLLTGATEGIDIHAASERRLGRDMGDVYDRWDELSRWTPSAHAVKQPFEVAELGPPSPHPRQVFAIGLNYYSHLEEAGLPAPEEPSVFTKFVSSFAGPDTQVTMPRGNVDWEIELVVIIGREAHRVPRAGAWEYVAGLSVGQDLSERASQLQGKLPQFCMAKSFPGFSPQGPALVTLDEVKNPMDLAMTTRLNGEVVQDARTSGMVFAIDVLIEQLSTRLTLYPGDVIFTGTPAGVGACRKPTRFLKRGDQLVSTIEGLGEIRQVFV
jgi:2,4-didehydro-3-deoxy-L-rhamnonate hydrolase